MEGPSNVLLLWLSHHPFLLLLLLLLLLSSFTSPQIREPWLLLQLHLPSLSSSGPKPEPQKAKVAVVVEDTHMVACMLWPQRILRVGHPSVPKRPHLAWILGFTGKILMRDGLEVGKPKDPLHNLKRRTISDASLLTCLRVLLILTTSKSSVSLYISLSSTSLLVIYFSLCLA